MTGKNPNPTMTCGPDAPHAPGHDESACFIYALSMWDFKACHNSTYVTTLILVLLCGKTGFKKV